jgi:hypothetical protein
MPKSSIAAVVEESNDLTRKFNAQKSPLSSRAILALADFNAPPSDLENKEEGATTIDELEPTTLKKRKALPVPTMSDGPSTSNKAKRKSFIWTKTSSDNEKTIAKTVHDALLQPTETTETPEPPKETVTTTEVVADEKKKRGRKPLPAAAAAAASTKSIPVKKTTTTKKSTVKSTPVIAAISTRRSTRSKK